MIIYASCILLVGNTYHVEVGLDSKPDALGQVERDAITQFGEPIIDLGGDFTGANELAFSLPTNQVRFPSQFPAKQLFPRDNDAEANAKAVAWRDTIQTRINTALTTLIGTSKGTTGRWVDSVTL